MLLVSRKPNAASTRSWMRWNSVSIHAPNTVLVNPLRRWACPLIPKAASTSLLQICQDDNGISLSRGQANEFLMPKEAFLDGYSLGRYLGYSVFYAHRPMSERWASYYHSAFRICTRRHVVKGLGLSGCTKEQFRSYAWGELAKQDYPDGENIDEHIRLNHCFVHRMPESMIRIPIWELYEWFLGRGYGELGFLNQRTHVTETKTGII